MHYEQKIKVPVYGSQCILFSKNDQVPSLSIHGLPQTQIRCEMPLGRRTVGQLEGKVCQNRCLATPQF